MANNDDWLSELQYIPLLRDIGRHFTINRMLTMDSVKLRLEREQPLTFLEFNYMILQSYDFVELQQALRLHAADGRLGPVGQHRAGGGARAAPARGAAVRSDLAADHDRLRRQDGQDGQRRRLAEPGAPVAVRLLAILAQYRGRRRRAVPAHVHRPAAGEIARLERSRARRSMRPRRCSPPRRRGFATARRRPATRPPRRRALLRAARRRDCPPSPQAGASRSLIIEVAVALGMAGFQERGAPADRAGRRPAQRSTGRGPRLPAITAADLDWPAARPGSAWARSATG